MFGIQLSREQTAPRLLPVCRIPPMRFLAALMRQAGLARQLEEIPDFSTLPAFVGNDRAAQIYHIPRRAYANHTVRPALRRADVTETTRLHFDRRHHAGAGHHCPPRFAPTICSAYWACSPRWSARSRPTMASKGKTTLSS